MKYAELFAGAGGMSLGLEAGGFYALAHAEIEPHARAVLRYRWPETRLDGDVTKVNGADYRGITLLSGGSPCQDLSVAGKRAGLTGSRSSLFHEQYRIWRESNAPYLLWENVGGALSSNKGHDFATVLSTIVGRDIVADGSICADKNGKIKWLRAGSVAGPSGVAAYRVLDLQHFGPPQRRVRVFILASRTGELDPAEILAFGESVCRHPSPRQQSRERAACGAAGGVGAGGVTYSIGSHAGAADADVSNRSHASGGPTSMGIGEELANALRGGRTQAVAPTAVLAFHPTQTPISGGVMAFKAGQSEAAGGTFATEGFTPTIQGGSNGSTQVPSVFALNTSNGVAVQPIPFTSTQTPKVGGDVLHTLEAASKTGGGQTPCVLVHEAPIVSEQQAAGRPRRLTPLECERLMSWPDQWTAVGRKEDGTEYALSDTARYRLCGNGVGSVCAEWIARRLSDALRAQEGA